MLDGAPVDYEWQIATETGTIRRSGDSQSITWASGGTYAIVLTATDAAGRSDTDNVSITVRAPTKPNPRIEGPATIEPDGTATFTGVVSIPEGEIRTWSWQSSAHGTRTGQTIRLDAPAADFTLTLTVTTVGGISRTSRVYPITVTDNPQYRGELVLAYGDSSVTFHPDGKGQRLWFWVIGGTAGDIPYTGSPTTSGCQPSRTVWQLRDEATGSILLSGTSTTRQTRIDFTPTAAHSSGVRITATATAVDSRCTIADLSQLIPYVQPPAGLVITGPTSADVGASFTLSVGTAQACRLENLEWTVSPPGPGAPPYPHFATSITLRMPDLSQSYAPVGPSYGYSFSVKATSPDCAISPATFTVTATNVPPSTSTTGPPTTVAPTTAAPTTAAPTTAAPSTVAPTTVAPTTAPTTATSVPGSPTSPP